MSRKLRRQYKPRDYYRFVIIKTGEIETFKDLKRREDAILIRSAAHFVGYKHGKKFKTKIREMDSGLFELSVRRVE